MSEQSLPHLTIFSSQSGAVTVGGVIAAGREGVSPDLLSREGGHPKSTGAYMGSVMAHAVDP